MMCDDDLSSQKELKGKPVSLSPLDWKAALAGLLRVKPQNKSEDS